MFPPKPFSITLICKVLLISVNVRNEPLLLLQILQIISLLFLGKIWQGGYNVFHSVRIPDMFHLQVLIQL